MSRQTTWTRKSRRELASYLATKRGFLVVSHDRSFLDGCADHIVSLNRTGAEVRGGTFSAWKSDFDSRQIREESRSQQLKKEIRRLEQSAGRSAEWSARREKSKKAAGDSGFESHRAAKLMKRSKVTEKRRDRAVQEKKALLGDAESAPALKMFPEAPPQELLVSFLAVAPSYPGSDPFSPATFDIRRGERVVVEGRNGSGKTSLLKLLAGENLPHTGQLICSGSLLISWLPQDTSGLRGSAEELISSRGLDWTQYFTMLRQLGFPRSHLGRPLEELSEGQRKKALLAASLCEKAHLYVWDEPLNYIDLYSREQIQELILRARPTLLMVEHDAAFLDAVATKRVQLERGKPAAQICFTP